MRVVYWGTYDTGKARTRILMRGLKEKSIQVLECHGDVWGGIEDKSQVSGWLQKLRLAVRWLSSYPGLVVRYMRLPRHDVVITGYLGQLDVLVLWPFARLRGVPIVWDAFLSLYNTVVEDRKFIGPKHPLAFLLFAWEYLSCRAADLVILDTRAHADYFEQRFKIPETRIGVVFVGVETDAFPLRPQSVEMRKPNQPLRVLFYGQFIPLQGIETIIRAARRTEHQPIQWVIIGSGQEGSKIRDMINRHPLSRLQWIPWVPYRELAEWIHRSDICLGIFGDSDKASRVIPNKVFQILSTGTPLITRDSPAIRELLRPGIPGVYLIPAMDDGSLVKALTDFSVRRHLLFAQVLHRDVVEHIEPRAIGGKVVEVLNRLRIIGS